MLLLSEVWLIINYIQSRAVKINESCIHTLAWTKDIVKSIMFTVK